MYGRPCGAACCQVNDRKAPTRLLRAIEFTADLIISQLLLITYYFSLLITYYLLLIT